MGTDYSELAINAEEARLTFRPMRITTLFVGESVPAGRVFFISAIAPFIPTSGWRWATQDSWETAIFLHILEPRLVSRWSGFDAGEPSGACCAKACLPGGDVQSCSKNSESRPLAIVSLLMSKQARKPVFAVPSYPAVMPIVMPYISPVRGTSYGS